ncbi:MAG: hypothetical protein PHF47_03280 [Bacilli bacterium]|nr:hypothetical protein [Bacilli bacterium]
MHQKKTLTLIKGLTFLVMMTLLIIFLFPVGMSIYFKTQEKAYELFINKLEQAATIYVNNNTDDFDGLKEVNGFIYISLDELVKANLLTPPVINPLTKDSVPLNTIIKITQLSDNKYEVELFYGQGL